MKKGKKSKSKKKGKKDKKKDKKKGKKKSKSAISSQVDDEKQDEKETEEVILKKVTLANFFCELHNLNWSDKTIDFYWADHPKANPNAISVNGSLRVSGIDIIVRLFIKEFFWKYDQFTKTIFA